MRYAGRYPDVPHAGHMKAAFCR